MRQFARVAVLGAGNWGTTLAHLVAANGLPVSLWTRESAQRDEINDERTNSRALPGLVLAPGVRASTDVGDIVGDAELILMAIPSQAFRAVCRLVAPALRPEHLLIHGTKGIELGSHQRMSEIILAETCIRQFGVLAGPNIASEIAEGKPAGTTVTSAFPGVVERGRRALSSARLRVFTGTDVLGVELCGALKNVVAIAAGIADEMQVGDNAKAFLLTRGMAELTRLAFTLGAEPATMSGLAGFGDLMVTCASPRSRNHRIGVALARGEKLEEATARLGMVAEGVFASQSARELARIHEVDMPLFEQVHHVIHEGLSPRAAIEKLMSLPAGRDVPGFMQVLRAHAAIARRC